MEISKLKVVSIDYVLKSDSGELIDKSNIGDPLVYIQGTGALIPGLESALEGKGIGDELDVKVSPDQGYGLVREDLFQEVSISQFEGVENLAVGMGLVSYKGPSLFLVLAQFHHGQARQQILLSNAV